MLDMIGLSDEMLPLLVEYNPMITVEILMIILKNKNKEEIKRYLRQITNINVTLQSLEGTWSQLPQFWSVLDEYILRSPEKLWIVWSPKLSCHLTLYLTISRDVQKLVKIWRYVFLGKICGRGLTTWLYLFHSLKGGILTNILIIYF